MDEPSFLASPSYFVLLGWSFLRGVAGARVGVWVGPFPFCIMGYLYILNIYCCVVRVTIALEIEGP